MVTYEEVVTKYGNADRAIPLEGTVVYTHLALDPNARATYEVEKCLRLVGGIIARVQDVDMLQPSLVPIRRSPELAGLVTRLAKSELDPRLVQPKSRTACLLEARRLFIARSVHHMVSGYPAARPAGIHEIISPQVLTPQNQMLEKLSMQLNEIDDGERLNLRRARNISRANGFTEGVIAQIALFELEPSWVRDMFMRQEDRWTPLFEASRMLQTTRNIARTILSLV